MRDGVFKMIADGIRSYRVLPSLRAYACIISVTSAFSVAMLFSLAPWYARGRRFSGLHPPIFC